MHDVVSRELWDELGDIYRVRGCMYHFKTSNLPQYTDIVDINDIELLEMVWNTYGDQDEISLEALCQTEDPWKLARGNCNSEDECGNEITLKSMKDYYSKIYSGNKSKYGFSLYKGGKIWKELI